MPARLIAIDYLRGLVVAAVVLHHAVLAYVSFGYFNNEHYLRSTSPVVDDQRWTGFDLLVVFNDGFFMPLLFLLSGLFVWSSLRRGGTAHFLRKRALRLGVPFAILVSTLMPIAHYPSYRLTGASDSLANYWLSCIVEGPWPAGPLWFVWFLLALNVLVALINAIGSDHFKGRVAEIGLFLQRRMVLFFTLVVASAVSFLPMLVAFGSGHWFAVGPLAVQASRVGLYAAYFLVGTVLGASLGTSDSASWPRNLGVNWWLWSIGALTAFFALLTVLTKYGPGSAGTPVAQVIVYGAVFSLFAATTSQALIAVSVRFAKRRHPSLESLAANSYGIYLVHYVFVVWLQFLALDLVLPAILKGLAVFSISITLSWGAVALLRRSSLVRSLV